MPDDISTSDERLQLLIDRAPVCIKEIDLEGKIASMNRKGLEILGLERVADIVGSPYLDLVGPPDRARVGAVLGRAFEGELGEVEFAIGSEPDLRSFRANFIPLSSKPGSVTGVLGISVELTRERRAQRDLAASERRYLDLYENAPDMFASVEPPDGIVLECNSTLVRALGRSKEEIIGQPVHQLFHPDCRDAIDAALEAFATSGVIRDAELQLVRGDGSMADVVINATAARDETGQILHSRSVIHDVTERRRAERELRELELAVENSMTGVSRLDRSGRFVDVRNMYARLHGYDDPVELVGQSWEVTIDPDYREACITTIQRMLENGRAEADSLAVRRDGSRFFKRVLLVKAYGGRGEYIGYYCLMNDITERFRSEQALRDAEQRLRHSQRIEALGRVSGGVAHDFNNLLTVIGSHGDILRQELGMNDSRREHAEQILATCQRAAALTRQLLAFSRKQVLELEPTEVHAFLADAIALMQPLIGESYEFAVDLVDDPQHVAVDPNQLSQVFVNLAVNARDAMPNGGSIRIASVNRTLSSERDTDLPAGDYVELTFSDSGEGMDDEIAAHVFEPFFTTKAAGHGSGLGLSTAFGILRQFGGDISVTSQPGAGTTFTILLPSIAAASPDRPAPAERASVSANRTVLLVEDDDAVRKVLGELLVSHGYHVLRARDADAAIALADDHDAPVDVLVTDIVMPGGTGIDLAGRLRERRPELPVVFVSGYSHTEHPDLQETLSAHFLQKPFSTPDLLRKLDEALAESPADGRP